MADARGSSRQCRYCDWPGGRLWDSSGGGVYVARAPRFAAHAVEAVGVRCPRHVGAQVSGWCGLRGGGGGLLRQGAHSGVEETDLTRGPDGPFPDHARVT